MARRVNDLGKNQFKQQQALALHGEGVKRQEIARRLGVNYTTVMRWLDPAKAERNREYNRERYSTDPSYAKRKRDGQRGRRR